MREIASTFETEIASGHLLIESLILNMKDACYYSHLLEVIVMRWNFYYRLFNKNVGFLVVISTSFQSRLWHRFCRAVNAIIIKLCKAHQMSFDTHHLIAITGHDDDVAVPLITYIYIYMARQLFWKFADFYVFSKLQLHLKQTTVLQDAPCISWTTACIKYLCCMHLAWGHHHKR